MSKTASSTSSRRRDGLVARLRRLFWLDSVHVHGRLRHDHLDSECPDCGEWLELGFAHVAAAVDCRCGATFYPCDHCLDVQTSEALRAALDELPGTVIVNFWRHGIGPCAFGMRRVEAAAKRSHGRFVFLRVHADIAPRAVEEFEVTKTPSLLRFEGGEIDGRIDGCPCREDLVSFAMHGVDLRYEDG